MDRKCANKILRILVVIWIAACLVTFVLLMSERNIREEYTYVIVQLSILLFFSMWLGIYIWNNRC